MLYLDNLFEENKEVRGETIPGKIRIVIKQNDVKFVIAGLLAAEPTIQSSNNFGPVLNIPPSFAFYSSLLATATQGNMLTWMGASAQVWKGTEPIRISAEFYLVNYKRGLDLERKIKELSKLTALERGTFGDEVTVRVHGGYAPEIFKGNAEMFQNDEYVDSSKIANGNDKQDKGLTDVLNTAGEAAFTQTFPQGTLLLEIGNRIKLYGMLLQKIDVTPSVVEVYNSGNPVPLYYRIGASFIGCRPLVTTDIENMYGGG